MKTVPVGVVTERGYGQYFIHRTGHGIGTEAQDPHRNPGIVGGDGGHDRSAVTGLLGQFGGPLGVEASGQKYRREMGDYDRRSDYNYYQQNRPYRGAESLYSCGQNYARDLVAPAAKVARPKALAKAAGKA